MDSGFCDRTAQWSGGSMIVMLDIMAMNITYHLMVLLSGLHTKILWKHKDLFEFSRIWLLPFLPFGCQRTSIGLYQNRTPQRCLPKADLNSWKHTSMHTPMEVQLNPHNPNVYSKQVKATRILHTKQIWLWCTTSGVQVVSCGWHPLQSRVSDVLRCHNVSSWKGEWKCLPPPHPRLFFIGRCKRGFKLVKITKLQWCEIFPLWSFC